MLTWNRPKKGMSQNQKGELSAQTRFFLFLETFTLTRKWDVPPPLFWWHSEHTYLGLTKLWGAQNFKKLCRFCTDKLTCSIFLMIFCTFWRFLTIFVVFCDFLTLFGDFCCFWWVFEHILSLPCIRRHTLPFPFSSVAPNAGKTQNVFKNSPKTTKIAKKCKKIGERLQYGTLQYRHILTAQPRRHTPCGCNLV